MREGQPGLSRREVLSRIGGGFGSLALASVFADAGLLSAAPATRTVNPLAPKPSHFPARAKRVIFLFMNGGPSHVDTFDPKPALLRYAGQAPPAKLVTGRPPQAHASHPNPAWLRSAGQAPPAKLVTGRRKAGKVMPSPFSAKPHG